MVMAKSKQPDRQFELKWLDPKTLKPNPSNWRSHPAEQTKLLDAVLGEVGWAGVALFNETTGHLIDGHARRDWAIEHGQDMPVLVGRWSENDEKKILATLDPLAGMAERMDEVYRELVRGIETDNVDLGEWLNAVSESMGVFQADETAEPTLKDGDRAPFQQMTFTLHDEQAKQVKSAMDKAKDEGGSESGLNENSNGNALAWICERFNRG
jgi:hypothetical protein